MEDIRGLWRTLEDFGGLGRSVWKCVLLVTLEDCGGLWTTPNDFGGLCMPLDSCRGLWRALGTLDDFRGLWRTVEDCGGLYRTLEDFGGRSTHPGGGPKKHAFLV